MTEDRYTDCCIKIITKLEAQFLYDEDMTEEHKEFRKQQAFKTVFQDFLTQYGSLRSMMLGNLREDPKPVLKIGKDTIGIVAANVYELIK